MEFDAKDNGAGFFIVWSLKVIEEIKSYFDRGDKEDLSKFSFSLARKKKLEKKLVKLLPLIIGKVKTNITRKCC